MKNKHIGSSFDSWLREEGIDEEVTAEALKRVAARQSSRSEEEQAWLDLPPVGREILPDEDESFWKKDLPEKDPEYPRSRPPVAARKPARAAK